jgi:class 3 adenylate cyclase
MQVSASVWQSSRASPEHTPKLGIIGARLARSRSRGASPGQSTSPATILFTDIVDSTAQAVAHGSAGWRDLVSRHNELAEQIIGQYGGQLVKTTGNGVIALFDSAERGIRAAAAIGDTVRRLAIRVRAGLHTAEVELGQGDVRGLAVHVAARIMAAADADEVLVSSTARDLADGSGLQFDDHGLHALKGLPGKRQIFRLVRTGERSSRNPAGAQ